MTFHPHTMKTCLTLLFSLALCHIASAQQWNVAIARPSKAATIVVPARSIIEFASYRGSGAGSGLTDNFTTVDFGGGAALTARSGLISDNQRYVGPVTITQTALGSSSAFIEIAYRITTTGTSTADPPWQLAIVRPALAPVKINVPVNSLIEFAHVLGSGAGTLTNNSTTVDFGAGASLTAISGLIDATQKYVGPVTITQSATGNAGAFIVMGYRITTTGADASNPPWLLAMARPAKPVSIYVPANAMIEFASYRGSGAPSLTNNSTTLDFGGGAAVTATAGLIDTTQRYVGPLTITQTATGSASAFIEMGYRISGAREFRAIAF